jgi:hypothetical protein
MDPRGAGLMRPTLAQALKHVVIEFDSQPTGCVGVHYRTIGKLLASWQRTPCTRGACVIVCLHHRLPTMRTPPACTASAAALARSQGDQLVLVLTDDPRLYAPCLGGAGDGESGADGGLGKLVHTIAHVGRRILWGPLLPSGTFLFL